MGRFMSPDWAAKPVTVPYAEFGDPQSLNLYSYVRNSPIARVDADGHMIVGFSPNGIFTAGRQGVDDGSGGLDDFGDNDNNNDNNEGQPQQQQQSQQQQQQSQQQTQQQQQQQHATLHYEPGVPSAHGKLEQLLKCTQTCSGQQFTVTSTHEPMKGAHQANTPHGRGEAADVRVQRGTEGKVLACAKRCGAGFGLDERAHPSAHANGPHVHIQIPKGTHGGKGDLP